MKQSLRDDNGMTAIANGMIMMIVGLLQAQGWYWDGDHLNAKEASEILGWCRDGAGMVLVH